MTIEGNKLKLDLLLKLERKSVSFAMSSAENEEHASLYHQVLERMNRMERE